MWREGDHTFILATDGFRRCELFNRYAWTPAPLHPLWYFWCLSNPFKSLIVCIETLHCLLFSSIAFIKTDSSSTYYFVLGIFPAQNQTVSFHLLRNRKCYATHYMLGVGRYLLLITVRYFYSIQNNAHLCRAMQLSHALHDWRFYSRAAPAMLK